MIPSYKQLPEVIRVKRRRTEDPLQALIFDRGIKKSKSNRYIFALAQSQEVDNAGISLLKDDSETNKNGEKIFRLLYDTEEDESKLPDQLSDLVNDYLSMEAAQAPDPGRKRRRRRSSASASMAAPVTALNPATAPDYVYDVYYRTKEVFDDPSNNSYERIGYIKFDEELENLLDDESDGEDRLLTDDEDSNAESFYQNDYPEDEDEEGYLVGDSDDFEDEDGTEDTTFMTHYRPHVLRDDFIDERDEENHGELDEYDELFDQFERHQLNPLQENEADEDEDDLESHRERIMKRLEAQIGELS
ncbi:RNA polymerase II transport factor [Komagataella phaffii CBS 7435]|uniref:Transcription factor Iwr1 domain-containing protein n=2 Tax=Komagataella phaffii TaxID=460519 RepID=C4R661_KOMPG|nr:uncharacterized protein PAS_chr3_0984 [Komagataella phaffii GS115]AOA63411.1 GQ67_04114T0 [Komagataella phaffii]CAH2449121.1 RNA polymerase II transport factor [Komagataella phaffii CBS 7435]AOA68772.1 GQ68_04087T0 [Komagataella phaffii GS115]CAY71047.1 Protein of unknown function, deletion causes hypersensitivity to the K1 killer toxin [Komagataella phaffii GS115]CCA39158.1 RNA polymerase II transport factor [Komagataella phaffii CBS 7435]